MDIIVSVTEPQFGGSEIHHCNRRIDTADLAAIPAAHQGRTSAVPGTAVHAGEPVYPAVAGCVITAWTRTGAALNK